MVFFAGALAGLVVGLAAGTLLQRPAGSSSLTQGRGFATAVALLALLVATAALANSNRRLDHSGSPTSTAGKTPRPTTTKAAASTTTATTPAGLISVPNVEHIARVQAVPILKRAGFKVRIESLPLTNVPAGFVISQNPLPAATAAAGSTVSLVVSARP